MRQKRVCGRPGLRPGPRWGSLQRSPRPPSWVWGEGKTGKGLGTGREREGKGRGGEGKGEERERGREGKGKGRSPPSKNSGYGLGIERRWWSQPLGRPLHMAQYCRPLECRIWPWCAYNISLPTDWLHSTCSPGRQGELVIGARDVTSTCCTPKYVDYS